MNQKVLIGIPVKSLEEVSEAWDNWMEKVFKNIKNEHINADVKLVVGEYYDTARNKIVEHALKHNYTHLLFIDDDIFMPFRGLQKLLEHEKDVIGFPAYAKELPLKSNVFPHFYFFSIPKLPIGKLMKVDFLGTGCMLINTDIFKKMDYPYFGVAIPILDEINGTKISYKTSEDEYFCRKVKKLGIDVFVTTEEVCEHYCKKQKMFFPSLSKMEDDGKIVPGDFFNIWQDTDPLYKIEDETFGNRPLQQTWSDLYVFERVLRDEKPDLIIELGTASGATATFFNTLGKVYTVDIREPHIPLHKDITFEKLNLYNEETIKKIKKMISESGKVFLFCDGGDKTTEFKTYAPSLKKGDIIYVHDYGVEIHKEDVELLVKALKLKEIKPQKTEYTLLKGWKKA